MGIRFDGLSTGLETSTLIDALLEAERRPLRQVQAREATVRSDQALFRELNTRLLALRDAALALDNLNSTQSGPTLDEEFLRYAATSEDESFVGATVTGNATPGDIDVRINEVATAGREISEGFADPAAQIASPGQSLQISVGGTQLVDYAVPNNGASLQDLVDAVNADAANDGSVRAELLFDGTDYRMIVSGTRAGAANAITLTTNIEGSSGPGSSLIDATLQQEAADADLVVFGVPVTRDSNDITDLVPGVTLHLERAHDPLDITQSTTVDVSRDDEAIQAGLQNLVDAYNSFRDFLDQNASLNGEVAGPLLGDSTLLRIEGQLRTAFGDSYEVTGNPFSTLSQIGVRFEEGGRLTLDAEQLGEALDQDALAVREMLLGDPDFTEDPITGAGAATAIGQILEPITRSGDGSLAIRIDAFDDEAQVLQQTIERMERRIEQREETLIAQFARLESLVSTLQAQGGFLQSAFQRNNDS